MATTQTKPPTMAIVAMAGLLLLCCFAPLAAAESNADNYFCRACGILVERTAQKVVARAAEMAKRVQAGTSVKADIDVKQFVDKACDVYADPLTDHLQSGCEEIVAKNGRHVAGAFKDAPSSPASVFGSISEVCVDLMRLCDPPEDLPPEVVNDECEQCLAVVEDIQAVLVRRKDQRDYLSKKHIWAVLDELCSSIPARHLPVWASKLESLCDELVEETEDSIAQAFIDAQGERDGSPPGKVLCGSSGLGVCKNRQGNWKGKQSPWNQAPAYHVTEHIEL